jgi:hypothetical protein
VAFVKKHKLTTPQVAFIVATRAALAGGVGLLVSGKLSARVRRAVGLALVTLGAVTTIPAARTLLGRSPFP